MPADDQQRHARHHEAPEEPELAPVAQMAALRPVAEAVDGAESAHEENRHKEEGAQGVEPDYGVAHGRPGEEARRHAAAAAQPRSRTGEACERSTDHAPGCDPFAPD